MTNLTDWETEKANRGAYFDGNNLSLLSERLMSARCEQNGSYSKKENPTHSWFPYKPSVYKPLGLAVQGAAIAMSNKSKLTKWVEVYHLRKCWSLSTICPAYWGLYTASVHRAKHSVPMLHHLMIRNPTSLTLSVTLISNQTLPGNGYILSRERKKKKEFGASFRKKQMND